MEELLLKYGFKQSETLPNEFKKGKNCTAIIWVNGYVSLSFYSPKFGRILDSVTHYNNIDLEKSLSNSFVI